MRKELPLGLKADSIVNRAGHCNQNYLTSICSAVHGRARSDGTCTVKRGHQSRGSVWPNDLVIRQGYMNTASKDQVSVRKALEVEVDYEGSDPCAQLRQISLIYCSKRLVFALWQPLFETYLHRCCGIKQWGNLFYLISQMSDAPSSDSIFMLHRSNAAKRNINTQS